MSENTEAETVETPAEGLWETAINNGHLNIGYLYGIADIVARTDPVRAGDIRQCAFEISSALLAANTAPAPLSGSDGSLPDALEKIAETRFPGKITTPDGVVLTRGDYRSNLWEMRFPDGDVVTGEDEGELADRYGLDVLFRAALAAVPPETAEMEGEPVAWAKPRGKWVMGSRFVWADERNEGWMKEVFTVPLYVRPADRLAARASSSGEAGDE